MIGNGRVERSAVRTGLSRILKSALICSVGIYKTKIYNFASFFCGKPSDAVRFQTNRRQPCMCDAMAEEVYDLKETPKTC